MTAKMKHFIYISDTKVDMLYSQIDKSLLKKIAAELRVDLNFGIASVGTTIKPNQTDETRYSKIRVLVEYLESAGEVGWIDSPKTYFKGSLLMDWGAVYDYDDAAYFRGKSDRTAIGLIGSRHHLIGSNSDALVNKSPIVLYSPREILKALASSTELPASVAENDFRQLIQRLVAIPQVTDLAQPLEFLAVNYQFWKQEPDKLNFLIGSPIYVALAN